MGIEGERTSTPFRRSAGRNARLAAWLLRRWKIGWVVAGAIGIAFALVVLGTGAGGVGARASTGLALGLAFFLLVGVGWTVVAGALHALWNGRPLYACLLLFVWPLGVRYTIRGARTLARK